MKLNTIKRLYDELNAVNFHRRLVRPVILISRTKDVHAHYTYGGQFKAYMAFNPADDNGLREMRATIYHEMVHQYVEEYLGLEDNSAHGDIFWLVYFLFSNDTFDKEETYE